MQKYTLNVRSRIFNIEEPIVMGILNVTPDSFFDGGKYISEKECLEQAEKMVSEGATIIDVGGYSTRPGAKEVSENEEKKRVLDVIGWVKKRFPDSLISIDTFRASVAEEAISAGADIINDVSGGELDSRMFETAGKLKVPYILMHMQGNPATMQAAPAYKNVTAEIFRYFGEKISMLKALGVNDLILDPGFGFGKNPDHNFQLLKDLGLFCTLGYPVMAGISRKSMINKILHTKPEHALNGTTVLNTIALLNGASVLRVHDVAEAVEAVKLVQYYTTKTN